LSQWRVVLVAQTVIERQVWPDFPLILGVGDVVLLFCKTLSGCAVIERTRSADVAQELNRLRRVRQEVRQVGVSICRASEAIRVETNESELAAELHVVIAVGP